jgi:hypothetical protein
MPADVVIHNTTIAPALAVTKTSHRMTWTTRESRH